MEDKLVYSGDFPFQLLTSPIALGFLGGDAISLGIFLFGLVRRQNTIEMCTTIMSF